MPNNTIKLQSRPKCPMCSAEMVYAAFVVNEIPVWVWLCNCRTQPENLLADIENARLIPGETLIYRLEVLHA